MGKYDNAILEKHSQGTTTVDIAAELGIHRSTVSNVLSKYGKSRKRVDERWYITFEPAKPSHKGQHAWRMFSALDRLAAGEQVNPKTEKELKGFLAKMGDRTWVYSTDRGFYWVPRKPEHGETQLIQESEL